MNIIKKVTVFVMGLVVIGVVATTIGVVTKTKTVEKSVTFELLDDGELAFDVYSKIKEYAIFDLYDYATNVTLLNVNDINYYTDINLLNEGDYYLLDNNSGEIIEIYEYGYNTTTYGTFDVITITFAVEVATPVIIKTLLVLIPLVFTASLIGYLSLSVKKGDE